MSKKFQKYGHAKHIFVYYDTAYSCFVLLDNGQAQFYQMSFSTKFSDFKEDRYEMTLQNKYRRFLNIFNNYVIDNNTEVVIMTEHADSLKFDFVYNLLQLMHSFTGCQMRRSSVARIITYFIKIHGIMAISNRKGKPDYVGLKSSDKIDMRKTFPYFERMYKFLEKYHLCPWINIEYTMTFKDRSRPVRHRRIMAAVGLYYMSMVHFTRKIRYKKMRIKVNNTVTYSLRVVDEVLGLNQLYGIK